MGRNTDLGWDEATRTVDVQNVNGERPDQACLVVLSGSRVGEMVRIGHGISVGRSSQADFKVADDGVSRIHIQIVINEMGRAELVDMGSRNGTFVNGQRASTVVLEEGDKIQIGANTVFKFSYADKLEESFQQRMYEAALRDPLTQLYNRRHLEEQLESEYSYVMRHRTPLCVVLIDVDRLQRVNEEHGFMIGDAVIMRVADLMRSTIRVEDVASRYGGEEFILLCRGVTGTAGVNIGNRVCQLIAQDSVLPEKPEVKLTASVGVAAVPDPRIRSAKGLLEAAEEAVAQAKAAGGNRVCLYG